MAHSDKSRRERARQILGRAIVAGVAFIALQSVLVASPAAAQAPERPKATAPGASPSTSSGGPSQGAGRPAAGAPAAQRGRRPTFVTIDSVVRDERSETRPIYGRLVAQQAGVVASRVRGAVGEIRAFVGQRVKKGDMLVVLLTDTLESERAVKAAEVAEFRARITTADAQLRLAEQELKRIEQLRSSAAFSSARYQDKRREVERYRSAVSETSARAKQAEAELKLADINLANATIRAPYDGVITQRHTETGAYLNVGEKVVSMTNDASLEVEAEVPSAALGGLRPGTRVAVDPETAPPFDATVRAIVPEENQLTRTRTVRFTPVANGHKLDLAANQSVVLKIPAGPARIVTTAHKDALLHRRGAAIMYVYADGKVMPREVRIGQAFGDRFEILSGLRPGDKVVTRGNERLRPGQEVQIRRGGGSRGPGARSRPTEGRMDGRPGRPGGPVRPGASVSSAPRQE